MIDDEVYGYRQVNVEAQRADPGSLLNRMRQMIRVAQGAPGPGRGEVRFLELDNRAVLAYLRSDGEETILAVHNLSGERQVVEMDLASFEGARPADLFSGEVLPPVAQAPYRLVLDRYQYRWLRLEGDA